MFSRFFALILLILCFPLLLIISIVIKLDSPGPAIFKQKRIGQFGNYFIICKFRTMLVGTPDLPSSQVSETDARFTSFGKIIRRFSLDELPQLFNILKGEMIFIGPRPALHNQFDLIELRKKAGVDKIKPGVTGWAQVNGRDNISLEKKVKLDKYYLENKSINLDFKIVFMTFLKCFGGDDLYGDKTCSLDDKDSKHQSAT